MEANYFTILWWFLPYIDMNQPWVYTCSPSRSRLPPPSPSHPSGASQCTSPEHPVSCIEPGLVIRFTYDNTHVSVYGRMALCIFKRPSYLSLQFSGILHSARLYLSLFPFYSSPICKVSSGNHFAFLHFFLFGLVFGHCLLWWFWMVVLEKIWESLGHQGNQPKYSLEGLMLKLKLQYFGHLMQRADLLEKTDAGKDWGQK